MEQTPINEDSPSVSKKAAMKQEKLSQLRRVSYNRRQWRTSADGPRERWFTVQCVVTVQPSTVSRQMVNSVFEGFSEIHTPKLIAGSSEGDAADTLYYKGQPACLTQSPQLHKQMAICAEFRVVFEMGPVYRGEDSNTHRHLCEFTGLDVEMEIDLHYSEVMDVVARLFVTIFGTLNKTCQKELEAVGRQYPFEPLKYLPKTRRLTFEEGVQMLKDAGVEVDPMGDLNTEAKRKLGQLVLDKYGTEFYILHWYPLAIRPFYTMPCHYNSAYSNSFDVFIRGEEIISGAQREHRPKLLEKIAQACGIELKTISTYIDAIRNGVTLHGGFGAGLERVVMLFLMGRKLHRHRSMPAKFAILAGYSRSAILFLQQNLKNLV
ncbi:hypothetical protein PRUPE_4G141600 [Prunus persica]|uniref:aspartate--tRNA ligase n=1 Tax=Prunus persica TaxID=3760 RepID=A0A251PKH0_PRUPE|nr:hypothetical protein PRUPE_4G141600 [Prunus persica]